MTSHTSTLLQPLLSLQMPMVRTTWLLLVPKWRLEVERKQPKSNVLTVMRCVAMLVQAFSLIIHMNLLQNLCRWLSQHATCTLPTLIKPL